jgi:hypothetical protein
MSNDINAIIRGLRAADPGRFNMLVEHIRTLEEAAINSLVFAIQDEALRQNQGRAQALQELLLLLEYPAKTP